MRSRVALSETSPAPTMGARGSAGVKHDPATPLRPVPASMTAAPAADMYAGHASASGDFPINYRGGYAGFGACETVYTGNFPATPQGTPGVASPYHGTYGSGHGTYGSGGNTNMGSQQYYWPAPYMPDQALAVPTTAYCRADTNQSPVAPSAQTHTQAPAPIPSSVQRATGQVGTPTRSASHADLGKSEGEEDPGAKSA